MLSIIIPTFNEESRLPVLLESIKRQDFNDREVIVADGGSDDRTLEIAEKYGCKVVPGGLPAKGRNEGAKVARGDLLLFLDADTLLPDRFLEKNTEDFLKRKLGAAIFFQSPRTGRKFFGFVFRFFYNWLALLFSGIGLFGGIGIMVRKDIHGRVGGFDERAKIAEDVSYLKKASKIAKHGIIRKVELSVSVRRYEKEGWFRVLIKHFFGWLYATFIGPARSDIFKYEFREGKK